MGNKIGADVQQEVASKMLLNVIIGGEPIAQQRHRSSGRRMYDPSEKDKTDFRWQLKAACPVLNPSAGKIRVVFEFHTNNQAADIDNFIKFYLDAMSPPKVKRKKSKFGVLRPPAPPPFAVWFNDRQVISLDARIERDALEPKTHIKVFEIADI